MAILGLLNTENYAANRLKNFRRKVFYDYPNGATTLTGLLGLMDDEDTDDPEFSWFEKRMAQQRTTTASQGTNLGPFKTSADGDAGDSALALTAGTTYIIVTADSSQFRVGHILRIPVARSGGTATGTLFFRITEDPATTGSNKVKGTPLVTVTAVDNGTTNENVGKEVLVVGSAYAQGAAGSSEAPWNLPVEPANYCQIFRTEFSFTGTALKTGIKFDETGPYKDKAKEAALSHMIEMEKAALFGTKTKTTGANSIPTYTTGGLLYFLELWEAGSTYGNTAATADSDDNKRIIVNAAGTITEAAYDGYLERVFRVTNNKASEKLVLCGTGFLNVINQMYKSRVCLDASLPLTETYGMNVVKHLCPFGTLFYKSHPLFNQNPTLRNCALILDVQNLKWRYMQGRDTERLTNRQNNNEDLRRDEYLTEGGFEVRFPESHMFLQNVTSFVP